MKRDILFRGKCLNDGEWIEGDLTSESGLERAFIIMGWDYDNNNLPGSLYVSEVMPDSIGQFTGLTDKNGKKIFEGDIVSVPVKRLSASNWWQKTNENHGFVGDFVNKVVEFVTGNDSSSFEVKDLPITREQIEAIQQPRGRERELQAVDDINFALSESEIIGNIFDNPEMMKNNE